LVNVDGAVQTTKRIPDAAVVIVAVAERRVHGPVLIAARSVTAACVRAVQIRGASLVTQDTRKRERHQDEHMGIKRGSVNA
jgi:hypothetical protein